MSSSAVRRNKRSKERKETGTKGPSTRYWEPLTDGVKWIEKYSESLERFFERVPEFITTFIATLAVFTFGATLRGECFYTVS